MKPIVRLRVLAGGIVMATVLASLAPTTSSRVDAQVTGLRIQSNGYYNPYGQGRYGTRTMFSRPTYGYSGYGIAPYRYDNRVGYGRDPYIRSYGGSGYYQPFYDPYSGRIYYGWVQTGW